MNSFLHAEPRDQVMLVRIESSRLTADVAHRIFAEVLQTMSGAPALLLDFRSVEFMDSTAIGELVLLGKKLRADGTAYAIAGLKPPLMSLIAMMRLDQIMHFSENVDSALEWLNQSLTMGTRNP